MMRYRPVLSKIVKEEIICKILFIFTCKKFSNLCR